MPQTLIHALLAASTAQGSQQYTANYSGIASQLRSDLLSNYDKIVPPVSNRTQAIYSSGSDVELEVRFFKIETINAAEGGIRIKVWLRMLWVDERLSWDPNAYQGLTHTHFWCEGPVGGETSEIWTPDVTPYNSREGIVHSLDPAVASVDHTGAVFYSRPGALDVLCRFSGLVAFPFDNLTCTVEFGGWMYSGAVQGLTPRVTAEGLGYSFGGQESTSGSSYQEFSIVGIETVPQNFAYSSAAGAEPWPIIEYQITLQRQSDFYVVVIIVPVIITTLLAFVVFFAPTDAADALGYGISVIVVVILQRVVLSAFLPVCGELLWVDVFIAVNSLFCMLALFQSGLNILIENHKSEFLLPMFITVGLREMWSAAIRRDAPVTPSQTSQTSTVSASTVSEDEHAESRKAVLSSVGIMESMAGVIHRMQSEHAVPQQQSPAKAESVEARLMSSAMARTDAEKLIYFEQTFFRIDVENNGVIKQSECDLFLSFVRLDMSPSRRQKVFAQADLTGDGNLTRLEFCLLCVQELVHVDLPFLCVATDNMIAARDTIRKRFADYWQNVAANLDRIARFVIPTAYLFSMAIVFGLNFSDDYLTNSARRMNEGAVHVSFTAAGVGWTIAFFLAGGFFHVLWYFAQRAERQHMKKRAAKEVERLGHLDRSLFNVASLHKQKTRDLHSGAPLAA